MGLWEKLAGVWLCLCSSRFSLALLTCRERARWRIVTDRDRDGDKGSEARRAPNRAQEGRREKPPNQKSRTHRSALLRSEEWSGRGAATCATDGSALPCPAAADPGGIRSRVFSLMSCACDHSSHSHSLLCSSLRPASALVKAILCALTWLTARRNCSCSSSAHLLPGSAMSVMFSFYASMFQGPPGWAGSCMHPHPHLLHAHNTNAATHYC